MSIFEKFFPGLAAKRIRAETSLKREKHIAVITEQYMNYSQHGASTRKNAFKTLDDNLYTADEDIGNNKEILMARSRQCFMGNAIARAAINKIRTNVVGDGLKLKSKIDNRILNLKFEERERIENEIQTIWTLWAESTECDIERQVDFYQLQSLALMTQLLDGDCFVTLPFRNRAKEFFELKVKLIDGSRCCSPYTADDNIKNGVEVDKDGSPIAYWFVKDEKTWEFQRVASHSPSGRKNVIVLMDRERIGQKRGVPLLAPVLETLLQLTRFTNAELMNAVVSSLYTAFITTDADNQSPSTIDGAFIDKYEGRNGKAKEDIYMGSGVIQSLAPGENVVFADPKRPNGNFEIFMMAMCKELGAAVEIPVEVLLSNFNASYSASKASLEEVWKMYNMRRSWLARNFCQPIFEELMDEAVEKGYIKLPGYFENPLKRKAYLSAEWYGQAQGQIDPLKEVKASVMKIENGLSTGARESRLLNGSDYQENIEQQITEAKLKQKLKTIKKGGNQKNVSTGE